MIIGHICDLPDILSVMRIINIVITLIKIIVPIVLIVSLMINYLDAVKSNDYDALQKANKQIVPKILAAVLIFYIPTFIRIIADVASYDTTGLNNCINNANKEYIAELIYSEAKVSLSVLKQTLKSDDYYNSLSKINKIKDADLRNQLLKELESYKDSIKNNSSSGKNSGSNSGSNSGNNISSGQSGTVANSLGVYFYLQCDSRWGNIEYDTGGGKASSNGHATICSSGCGYTSFAMIAAGLNNNPKINPYEVIKYMRGIKDGELTNRGFGAAGWYEIANDSMISKYNLKHEDITKSQIVDSLKANKPVIILVPNHYMVLSISSSGKIVLMDPYTNWADGRKKSGEYNSVSDIENIYGSISKAVAYSKI